jgi:flagellar biogenesis protein FliO
MHRTLSISLGLSILCLSVAARAEPAEPAPAEAEIRQAQLRKKLLSEILAGPEDGPQAAPAAADAPAATPLPAEPAPPAEPRAAAPQQDPVVGTAVASVPTWPVLALACLLASAVLWMRRKGQRKLAHAAVTKLAAMPLGGRRSLALVEVMGQKLLLGLSEKGLSLLARIDDRDPSAEGPTGDEQPEAPVSFEAGLAALARQSDRRDQLSTRVASGEERELAARFGAQRGA